MNITFRPIDTWPGELRRAREHSPFKAGYQDTLRLLDRELGFLNAKNIVIQLALTDNDIRLDGLPRADARPLHPGVILAFDSKHGPLKYSTDVYDGTSWRAQVGWQANLRAIALGLEALRKVDRYGITRRGEQYTGWKAIGGATAMPVGTSFTLEEAAQFLIDYGEPGGTAATVDDLLAAARAGDGHIVDRYYRTAAKTLHPDTGGDPDGFRRLGEARRIVLEAGC